MQKLQLQAIGYTLDELRNDITGGIIPSSFEPSIDYVVTKIPRFAFEKFKEADPHLTTQMKSVGEVMAIGGSFKESLQKALRGLEIGIDGLTEIKFEESLVLQRETRYDFQTNINTIIKQNTLYSTSI